LSGKCANSRVFCKIDFLRSVENVLACSALSCFAGCICAVSSCLLPDAEVGNKLGNADESKPPEVTDKQQEQVQQQPNEQQ
jgi:hypothetical protein